MTHHAPLVDILPLETNAADATHALILLHGYGADGFDLLSLGALWQQDLAHLAVFALNAPEPCEEAPGGRQWFSLRSFWRGDYRSTATAAGKAVGYVHQALEATADHLGCSPNKIFLMGFSQGSMMALATLYAQVPLAGVLSYAGGFHQIPYPAPTKPEVLATPVLLVHGGADDVVPPDFLTTTHTQLQSDGFTATAAHLIQGLGHSLDEQGFLYGKAFLAQHT